MKVARRKQQGVHALEVDGGVEIVVRTNTGIVIIVKEEEVDAESVVHVEIFRTATRVYSEPLAETVPPIRGQVEKDMNEDVRSIVITDRQTTETPLGIYG